MTRDCDIGNVTVIFSTMSFYDAVETLEEYDIKVQDAEGNVRPLYDVLDEVSKVWKRVFRPSASNKLSEAAQCLISSFKNANIPEQDDTVLDDFLKQFERSDEMLTRRNDALDAHHGWDIVKALEIVAEVGGHYQ